jgi:hypothetical protein
VCDNSENDLAGPVGAIVKIDTSLGAPLDCDTVMSTIFR